MSNPEINARSSRRMQLLLDTYNLTPDTLSERISFPVEAITSFLEGDLSDTPDLLVAIANKFDVSLDYFFMDLGENSEIVERLMLMPISNLELRTAFIKELNPGKCGSLEEVERKARSLVSEDRYKDLQGTDIDLLLNLLRDMV